MTMSRKTAAISIIVVLGVVLLAGFRLGVIGTQASGNAPDRMSVDMDPFNTPANDATSLGTVEVCARVNENNVLDADEDLADQKIWPTTSGTNVSIVGSATATTVTISGTSPNWQTNVFAGDTVNITIGTGSPQSRTIASNTANQLTLTAAWTTIPDTTSRFDIHSNDNLEFDVTITNVPAAN